MDGADPELVGELLREGKLPTLARVAKEGAFGELRSTLPAVTPTAWSSFLTGLNPAGHGIFNFSSNANRTRSRVESAASRAGTPLWRPLGAAGVRSAFVTVPFTYPAEEIQGVVVTGYGGPERPQILPASAGAAILARQPDLVTARHPMKERWWEDFPRYAGLLIDHADQVASVCDLCFELEPDMGLLVVDFMSTDFAGHLGYHRLDPGHPAHDPAQSGDELVRVYQAVDAACGRLIEAARSRFGEEPTVLIMSDHGMKPIRWVFHVNRWLEQHGHLVYRRRSLQRLRGGRWGKAAVLDQRLARTQRWYPRLFDVAPGAPPVAPDRTFGDVDFSRTRAYSFATGGQVYLGETTRAYRDRAYADRLAEELAEVPHPDTGEPLFEVHRKRDIYHGPFTGRAPDMVIVPRDERVHVDSLRRHWPDAFSLHDTLDPEHAYGYSGHHGVNGILAACGPGIRPGTVPGGTDITQMAATILRLHGLEADALDGAAIEAILSGDGETVKVSAAASAGGEQVIYSDQEEADILARLRDLGYE
jgi:predicted AlkP superfamily phosphohydrolase/phosphomutase